MDFNNYKLQIKELLLKKNDPSFNNFLNKILINESASDKFLIKMEINRLSTPCRRVIDLRGKVSSECFSFQYENTQHYLDKNTQKVFLNSIEVYGEYTVGTFEDVMAHQQAEKKDLQNKTSIPTTGIYPKNTCKLIHLSEKNQRAAPRMFFVSDIAIEFDDGTKIFAQTTNISISGLKVKLKNILKIKNKSKVNISFLSLQKDHPKVNVLSSVPYQLVHQETIDNSQYIYLNYANNDSHLISFIQAFIRNNQHKYKIDVHYYYQLAANKLLTNFYLENSSKLTVCLNSQSSTPFLFSLENKRNRAMINYWLTNDSNDLYSLFTQSRLQQLLSSSKKEVSTTLYSFTYVSNGISYYLSATEEELVDKEVKELFIHFGCNKDNWRIFNLSITNYHHSGEINHSISSKTNKQLLANISHISTLEDITFHPYISTETNKKDLNKLNQFVHHKITQDASNNFQLFPIESRKAPRYIFKSNIIITYGGTEYSAQIINFSLSGLMVKLKKALDIAETEELSVNLIDLQKVSPKVSLADLKYKLINTSPNNTLNLKVVNIESKKIVEHFFALLIEHNSEHFKTQPTQEEKLAFSDELIKIQGVSHLSCALFVNKEKNQFNVKFATVGEQNKAIKTLFTLFRENENEIDITPINNNNLYKRLISHPLHAKSESCILKETFIYIKTTQNEDEKWTMESFLNEDFQNRKEQNNFIKSSTANTQRYILHFRLTQLNPPDFSIVQHEVDAISRFALHLTKKLQDELHAMSGLIEITDCTEIVNNLSKKN